MNREIEKQIQKEILSSIKDKIIGWKVSLRVEFDITYKDVNRILTDLIEDESIEAIHVSSKPVRSINNNANLSGYRITDKGLYYLSRLEEHLMARGQ